MLPLLVAYSIGPWLGVMLTGYLMGPWFRLPLLQRAQQVTLAVVNSHAQPAAHGEQPGADLALYLARHGVNVEVLQHDTPPGQDVGTALLAIACSRAVRCTARYRFQTRLSTCRRCVSAASRSGWRCSCSAPPNAPPAG